MQKVALVNSTNSKNLY